MESPWSFEVDPNSLASWLHCYFMGRLGTYSTCRETCHDSAWARVRISTGTIHTDTLTNTTTKISKSERLELQYLQYLYLWGFGLGNPLFDFFKWIRSTTIAGVH